ncbi:MAG: hypothetical protein IKD91_03890, partial [Clostridiales bacterium]|nr:hypothetical protein [Clostridiales bacterium]
LTYPILALFEILLFLDTFCNTNVSDYRTGEFGLSAWTLSLLSYLEKSIYQNSRVKTRALSRASAGNGGYASSATKNGGDVFETARFSLKSKNKADTS